MILALATESWLIETSKTPKKMTPREIQTRFSRKATGFSSPIEMSIKRSLFLVEFQVSKTLILAYVSK